MKVHKDYMLDTYCVIFNIDNKEIELKFVLNYIGMFYCNIYIRTKEDIKQNTYSALEEYNFIYYSFTKPRDRLYKLLTARQVEILRKKIKQAYGLILPIIFKEIQGDNFFMTEKQLNEYEQYRKHIDYIH